VFNLWFANWFVSLVFQVHDVGTSYFGHFARTADIAADFILMVVPIKLFQDILEKGLRRRLMLIFSASIMTTVVSLVHKGYILAHGEIRNLIAAGVEVCKRCHQWQYRLKRIRGIGLCFADCLQPSRGRCRYYPFARRNLKARQWTRDFKNIH
jgi:hypothetical protein